MKSCGLGDGEVYSGRRKEPLAQYQNNITTSGNGVFILSCNGMGSK